MMWIFLLSDAFTFSSLLVAYGAIRFSHPEPNIELIEAQNLEFGMNLEEKYAADGGFVEAMQELNIFTENNWPSPDLVFNHFPSFGTHIFHGMHLPLMFVSLMTLILIISSVTMVLAVEAGQRMQKREVGKYMIYTILGGIAFLSCQAWEWTIFITEGAALHSNPFGPVSFAALFFFVTGFHGFHVLSGVVINIIIYLNVRRGTYEERGHYEMVEKTGLYWHFVDLVWVFVFTFFYLI